jgi:signal transduction histidine kinase
MLQLLHNPLVIKLAALLVLLVATLVVAMLIIRHLRSTLVEASEDKGSRVGTNDNAFTLAAYEGVIRKLKEQEKELERLRRADREQANESASMSETVLSNLSSGVVLFNNANLVRQANPAARSLLGYQSASGLHARDIFRGVSQVRLSLPSADFSAEVAEQTVDWKQPGPAPLVEAVAASTKEGALFRRIEADYRTPAGENRVLGITISPVRNYGGDTVGAAALLSDLTEITNLGRQMRLRESMAALGEMSAGIAHEFKNSLATISGYAQMLERDVSAGSGQQFAGKIATETSSLARIVNDFLQFAKPEGLQHEEVDLREVLCDCARETGVELDASGLPPQLIMEGDATALRQSFSNLLRNSAEATGTGVSPRVVAQASTTPTTIILTLTDNGQGIAEDQIARIFIPFFTTKANGTGLGLALVHRIITQHGGAISVASSPKGTGFTITLPALISPGIAADSAPEPE